MCTVWHLTTTSDLMWCDIRDLLNTLYFYSGLARWWLRYKSRNMQIFALNKRNSLPNKAESTEAQKRVLGHKIKQQTLGSQKHNYTILWRHVWQKRAKPQQLSVMTVGVPAKIGPGHIKNTCHKSCHLSKFALTLRNSWAPNTWTAGSP